MKKKQKAQYLSCKLIPIAFCFFSSAFAQDKDDFISEKKNPPNILLQGSFTTFLDKSSTKRPKELTRSSIPSTFFLKDSNYDYCFKCAQESSFVELASPTLIPWLELSYPTKFIAKISLEQAISAPDIAFILPTSHQQLAGCFTIPPSFKKRHVKNLPDLLIFSLKDSADKRLPYLGVIAAQPLYNPIPCAELVCFKSQGLIHLDAQILQNFDTHAIDAYFQKSLYVSTSPLFAAFVFPEKESLLHIKQIPHSSSFSQDPLFIDTNSFAFAEQNIQNITFIPSQEVCAVVYTPSYNMMALEHTFESDSTALHAQAKMPPVAFEPTSCHQDKFSCTDIACETAAFEAFMASMAPAIIFHHATESAFAHVSPTLQAYLPTSLSFASAPLEVAYNMQQTPCCEFLEKPSFKNYVAAANFSQAFFKTRISYKQGMALSASFSFEPLEKPLHIATTCLDHPLTNLAYSQEILNPLSPTNKEIFFLGLKHQMQEAAPLESLLATVPEISSQGFFSLEKIFFQEMLTSSITPADLQKTTDYLQSELTCDLLATSSQRKLFFEKASSLEDVVSFIPPSHVNSFIDIAPTDKSFGDISKYLDCVGLLSDPIQHESKPYLEEKIALFEIQPSVLNAYVPAHLNTRQDQTSLPTLASHSLENGLLLSYQKNLKARLNDYNIIVEKPVYENHLDPITCANTTEIFLSGKLEDSTPTISSSIAKAEALRATNKNLKALPQLEELGCYNATDDFIHDIHVTPNPKGTGYLFSVTLLPQKQKLETNCPQNYIFLLDRSGSIDKTRFQSFKQGVMKSLLYLKDYDTFNIITFDSELSKMSHESVFATQATKHGAKRYLENQKRGYQYGIPNIPQILLSLQPLIKKSSLPTTVVLLTSGKTLENYNKALDEPLLKKQLKANKNSFTLFTAGCQDVSDAHMLEMLSCLNRGEYMISQTNAAFPRKLAALVKHATYLAASNVHITTAHRSANSQIELYPNAPIAPNLYGDKPYTIVGKIDKLADFDLVLQGRFCDNWIFIKKKVAFSAARHGGHSILKDFKTFTSYNQYHEHFEEGAVAASTR